MPQSESRDKALKTMGGNQYDLTLAGAYRARQLAKGDSPRVPVGPLKGDNERFLTIALQEIAAGVTGREMLSKANSG